MAFTVTIKDQAAPAVKAFIEGLKNRTPMNRMAANRVRNACREHLILRSLQVRNKLGAPTSGFWAKAARNVARAPITADQSGAIVSLEHPGLARAFGPVTIRPTGGKKFLTIPLIAAAYNKRAYRIKGLFPRIKKGASKGVLSKRGADGSIENWYALVPQVNQKQDRTILPSDAALEAAAIEGVKDYATKLVQASGSNAAGGTP